MQSNLSNSELNQLIPPEIKHDEFYAAIQKIARQENIKTVLEIGSSSGGGSTEAFVTGLRANLHQPQLFCMEVSKPRFAELQKTYANDAFVHCYNVSSVGLDAFPSEDEVAEFYHTTPTNLNYYPLERIISWLHQDIAYVKDSGVEGSGIEKIKQENNIDFFDVVLIDGSEFTGCAELDQVYGAKFILLDDINAFKNYHNHQKLLADKGYILIAENKKTRNGYSIFKKASETEDFIFEVEKAEQSLAKNLIRPGMTVFDVGANIGDYSILLSRLVGSSGQVYSFEPASSTFQKLRERLEKYSCQNVHPFQNAVFSRNQPIEFNEFPEDYSVWNSIGKPAMLEPQGFGGYVPIVKTEVVDAIALDTFCQEHQIETIDYLKLDVEGAESDALQGATQLLARQAIRFIQFEISQKMLEGLNRKAEDTFTLLAQHGYECHRIQPDGSIGEQVFNSNAFYENYIAFPALPIHFFTIVLNGEPFIRYHIDVLKQLPYKWHWHIIEGVADLKHDTAWSLNRGGAISDAIHHQGRSKDGTTAYLDELAQLYPENVTVYRKPEGQFWDGKLEMVNAPLDNISEECLLWQIDVDELWTVEQISNARRLFVENPHKTAAFYWCWYFVGENLVISTRNCYAQNPHQEWLRTWRFRPGAMWVSHEPPRLAAPLPSGEWQDVAAVDPFSHEETESQGLVFQHFAYVLPEQLQFKEQYYGYTNAGLQWQALQQQTQFPVFLSQYFAWVQDRTMVDTTASCGIVPIAQKTPEQDEWKFLALEELKQQQIKLEQPKPTILVDGVFFQLFKTGIARVWRSLLEEWVKNGFAKHVIVLDRARTAPMISGIKYRFIPPYDYNNTDSDRQMLQQICDEEGADLFISTYYTTPLETPSVFMAHDMIPEIVGANLQEPMWREKHYGIRHASAFIAVSENTAHDLVRIFPEISPDSITVAPNGIGAAFVPSRPDVVSQFKAKYGITKPYFLLVGARGGYKNAIIFFKAFAQLFTKSGFDLVCTGVVSTLEEEYRAYTIGTTVHMLQLSDEELAAAYTGAVALVYPSKYEGFGLPVAEAMASGCPVITCPNASLPEVAGEAALYVADDDVDGLVNALCEVQKPEVRQRMITTGLKQAQQFSWATSAERVGSALIKATLLPLKLNEINWIAFPDWNQPEEALGMELIEVIRVIATHPDRDRLTFLLYTGTTPEEDINLLLSGVTMHLLLEEELDVSDGPVISLVNELSQIQWTTLLSQVQSRVALENEDLQAIAAVGVETLPVTNLSHEASV